MTSRLFVPTGLTEKNPLDSIGFALCETPRTPRPNIIDVIRRKMGEEFLRERGRVLDQPRTRFFYELREFNKLPEEGGLVSIVVAPRTKFTTVPLERLLSARVEEMDELGRRSDFLGLLIVDDEHALTLEEECIRPRQIVQEQGPIHAVNLGIQYGFHVLETTTGAMHLGFERTLDLLKGPTLRSGWNMI